MLTETKHHNKPFQNNAIAFNPKKQVIIGENNPKKHILFGKFDRGRVL
jgi:hypothetical protein